jgi:hypothetical protein
LDDLPDIDDLAQSVVLSSSPSPEATHASNAVAINSPNTNTMAINNLDMVDLTDTIETVSSSLHGPKKRKRPSDSTLDSDDEAISKREDSPPRVPRKHMRRSDGSPPPSKKHITFDSDDEATSETVSSSPRVSRKCKRGYDGSPPLLKKHVTLDSDDETTTSGDEPATVSSSHLRSDGEQAGELEQVAAPDSHIHLSTIPLHHTLDVAQKAFSTNVQLMLTWQKKTTVLCPSTNTMLLGPMCRSTTRSSKHQSLCVRVPERTSLMHATSMDVQGFLLNGP